MKIKNLTDEQIIKRVQKGKTEDFGEIVKRYSNKVFSIGMRFFYNTDDSADFSQEVFFKAFSNINSYREIAPFRFWLVKLAYNLALNIKKSKKEEFSSIEEKDFLKENLILNAERSEVTFMRFQISRESAQQIIDFLNIFQGYVEEINGSPSNYYGGIFMPLYYGEGSGCTALCVAAMEAAGIVFDEETKNEWMVSVDLPMNLIGGEFNNDKKIALKRIKKTKSWYKGKGLENVDYVNFDIYDANHIFEWVNKRINSMPNITCSLSNSCKIKGISFDYTHIKADGFLLQQYRPNPNLFINKYFELLK